MDLTEQIWFGVFTNFASLCKQQVMPFICLWITICFVFYLLLCNIEHTKYIIIDQRL